MKKSSSFRALLPSVPDTVRWPLTKVADLLDQGFTLEDIASLPSDEIADHLQSMRVKKPDKIARDLKRALVDLRTNFPGAGIPPIVLQTDGRNRLPMPRDEPRRLRCDLVLAWRKEKRERCEQHSGSDVSRSTSNFGQARYGTRTLFAALKRSPAAVRIGNEVGIETITHPKVFRVALDQMRAEGYAPASVVVVGRAAIRILRWTVDSDHPHEETADRTLKSDKQAASKAMTFEEVAAVLGLLAAGALTLFADAPQELVSLSEGYHRARKDRVARLSYALALSLKMNHPGLTERAVIRLHLSKDIVFERGKRCLKLPKGGNQSGFRFEVLSEKSVDILEKLRRAKEETNLVHPLLFPTRAENFAAANGVWVESDEKSPKYRDVAATMQELYAELEFVTGIKTTFTQIKDTIISAWLEAGMSTLKAAKLAGYVHERSLIIRYAHFLKARKPDAGGDR